EAAEPTVFDRRLAPEPSVEPVDELRDVVASSRRYLSEHDLRLLDLLTSGRSIPEVASALEVSVRTVGYHRDALVHRLRAGLVA
ncbi:MAG: LuxR C-terminal-related transcriptional regulator, partial [Ilumatobacteraceae bacterium]